MHCLYHVPRENRSLGILTSARWNYFAIDLVLWRTSITSSRLDKELNESSHEREREREISVPKSFKWLSFFFDKID